MPERAHWVGRVFCMALAIAGILWGVLMALNPKGVESRVFFEKGERFFDDFVSVRTCAEYGYANDRQELKDACYPALGPIMVRPFPLSFSGAAWFTGVGIVMWGISFLVLLRSRTADRAYDKSGETNPLHWSDKGMLVLGCLLSSIMLHEFEWGNQIVYAAALTIPFVAWYDSKSRILQFVAAVALAGAAVLKITPVVLGWLYLDVWLKAGTEHRKRILGAVMIFVCAGIVLFAVPFMWYGGFDGFSQWLANASANAKGYVHKGAWGFVPIGRTIRVLRHIDVAQPWANLWVERGFSVVLGLSCFITAIWSMLKNTTKRSDLLLLLVATMLLVPGNMHVYTGLYLLSVLALRLKEGMGWLEACCWFAMLCPLQIPFGAGCLNHPLANLAFLGLVGMALWRGLRGGAKC